MKYIFKVPRSHSLRDECVKVLIIRVVLEENEVLYTSEFHCINLVLSEKHFGKQF